MPKKHNIAYVKPEEPSFLRKLKQQIGYKEGPNVDTKREDLGPVDEEDLRDTEEEQPQIVVLRPGDLTAEEAAHEKLRLEKEEEEKPADLSSPIVFKKPAKKESLDSSQQNTQENQKDTRASSKRPSDSREPNKKSKKLKNKSLLSFAENDGEED